MKKILMLVPALLLGLIFSGCVVKQKVGLDYYAQMPSENAKSYPEVNVLVHDRRAYVVSGDKDGSFIGLYRAGFGIPYDVNTRNNVPLAQLLQNDLTKELHSLGFIKDGGSKTLVVDVLEWKFDAMQNAKFYYELDVKVMNSNKQAIAKSTVSEDLIIKGTFWAGGKGGVERDMPKIYIKIIQKIVRENKEILKALK